MTDATPLASEQITQEDRDEAHAIAVAWDAGRYDDAGRIVARHRIAALSATPAPSDQDASQAQGEVPWNGGREAPDDWNGGKVRLRDGSLWPTSDHRVIHWGRYDVESSRQVVAYTPKPAPGATAQDGAVVDRPLNTTDVVDHETASDVTQAPPTIPAGMVVEDEAQACCLASSEGRPCDCGFTLTEQAERDHNGGHLLSEEEDAPLAAAPKQAEPQGVEEDVSWEVWQDDMCVAASTNEADARHYCLVYSQDGPVILKRAVTRRFALNAPTGAVEKERGA